MSSVLAIQQSMDFRRRIELGVVVDLVQDSHICSDNIQYTLSESTLCRSTVV